MFLNINWIFILLFGAGAVFSTREYRQTGNALLAYVAIAQIAIAFMVLATLISKQPYDIWYYLSHLIMVAGFLVLMFGLLSEYVHLYLA